MKPNLLQVLFIKIAGCVCRRIKFKGMYPLLCRIAKPGGNIDYKFAIDFYGHKYNGNLSDHVDWYVYFYGAYEKPLISLLRNIVSDINDCVMIDVGGNTAHHSLSICDLVECVHAFEPHPLLWRVFERRLICNEITNVSLHKFALGESNGSCEFFPPNSNNMGLGSLVCSKGGEEVKDTIMVEVKNGDEYLSDIDLYKVDIIKVDVEGFEPYVLNGLKRTIENNQCIVIVERGPENRTLFNDLSSFLNYFPENYRAVYFNRVGMVIVGYKLDEINDDILADYYGNIILYPKKLIDKNVYKYFEMIY